MKELKKFTLSDIPSEYKNEVGFEKNIVKYKNRPFEKRPLIN
jgi:hypothetical protein